MNLAHVLVDACRAHAQRPALRLDDQDVGFGELERRARAEAARLRRLGAETETALRSDFPTGCISSPSGSARCSSAPSSCP